MRESVKRITGFGAGAAVGMAAGFGAGYFADKSGQLLARTIMEGR